MATITSNDFLTARERHMAVVGGKDIILRCISALEHLQLFCGYMHTGKLDVYTKHPGERFNCRVVDSFEGIDFVSIDNVLCTSVSQTINDMLDEIDSIDEQPLVESLSKYYYTNKKSFTGLLIKPENMERFNRIKDWAVEYYDEV